MELNNNLFHWSLLSDQDKKKILLRPISKSNIVVKNEVKKIISNVRKFGDNALLKYSKIFDNYNLIEIKKNEKSIIESKCTVSQDFKNAVTIAKNNIIKFHNLQKISNIDIEIQQGVRCQKLIFPIESVGLYIPGGSAPLISTVLMLVIPAIIAKCKRIILCSPPKISNKILYTAQYCGINEIYEIGGAQAIAAMSYGTQTVPKVDKIFGPGNAYVTEAKLQVSKNINGPSIDMLAGPSELLIIADENANANFIALDLLSQAEHGYDSQVILLTPSIILAKKVIKNLSNMILSSKRLEFIRKSLSKSRIIITNSLKECISISNVYAPEHLSIQTLNPRLILQEITNAGSVFLGEWSPESAGDYASGTNHVLPTYGSSKSISGLGLWDFQKSITVQELTREGLLQLSTTIETLALSEKLYAHKNAVTMRLNKM
ncbi:Histidinol dehydrogenase [Buchnera aphidicola (Thelaxes suberi)]|uniref:histidinol dehydrogenase n=1 Tax=Buchnera aphidicola TaxID=9 RepID=UPI003464BC39